MNFPFKKYIPSVVINRFWHFPKGVLAAALAGFPARGLVVIAVAGTKGKTSTAYAISHLLDVAGVSNALFTTAVLKIAGEENLNVLKLTTPTPFYLQSFLQKARAKGCTHVVLEVSSHALLQHRTWGIPFHYVVLTNLSPDHREVHASDAEYHNLHKKLITSATRKVILNGDDSRLTDFQSLSEKTAMFRKSDAVSQDLRDTGIPLVGEFNLMNVAAAYHACRALDIPHTTILKGIATLKGAPGRMEHLMLGQPFSIIVDYAHSPESLTNFFEAVRPMTKGRVIVVFGACGERDPSKRPIMGAIIDNAADTVIITNDDPYSESPEKISAELLKGIQKKTLHKTLFLDLDRRNAIRMSLRIASEGDTVCILGKGAEQWQVIGGRKIPWDDRTVVQEELDRLQSGLSPSQMSPQ